nr:DoxX family protein [Leeuwenhoekiella nanhaiensis]
MILFFKGLALLTGITFISYGISCLLSQKMKDEFIRFGLKEWRTTTGYLQLIGGLGMITGTFFNSVLLALSAAGLALLMLMGFITRLRIRDSILASSPAFIFMLVNLVLAVYFFKN